MKSFLAAILAIVGIGLVSSLLLETQQRTADVAYSTKGARVDHDPRLNGGTVRAH
jgi:hypothetical protein